jgi:hypothetical protein
LYRFVARDDPSSAESRKSLAEVVYKAALMREAALKSVIFVGVPRVSFMKKLDALGGQVTKCNFRRSCL